MTCYLISQGGEPVALVASLEMTRAIIQCQPWGEYLVEPLEVGDPIPPRPSRVRKPPIDVAPSRLRRQSANWSPRWNQASPAAPVDRTRRHAR